MDVVLPTMAGILRRRGYDARGFVSHVILKPSYGVAEGFSEYDYTTLNVGHPHDVATARQLTDLALKSFEKQSLRTDIRYRELPEVGRDCLLADIPAIVGSIDVVMGQVDR